MPASVILHSGSVSYASIAGLQINAVGFEAVGMIHANLRWLCYLQAKLDHLKGGGINAFAAHCLDGTYVPLASIEVQDLKTVAMQLSQVLVCDICCKFQIDFLVKPEH